MEVATETPLNTDTAPPELKEINMDVKQEDVNHEINGDVDHNHLKETFSDKNANKKIKKEAINHIKENLEDLPSPIKIERCTICRQYMHELILYNGHPNNSVDEYISLTDERLILFTGSEQDISETDERPIHKITYFNVYDKKGHLCPFDTGLIEENKLLYFSGFVKPVYDDDPSTENGLPTKDMGPINEWYISGFDGGDKAIVGFSTGYAEYYLQQPSPEYEPVMNVVNKKILLAKVVIEFLLEEGWQRPNYEDLLQRLEAAGDPDLNEDALLRHAQFICDRVNSFDAYGDSDDELLITAPCMRSLVKLAGVTFKNRQKMRKMETKGVKKKSTWSKATTTNLVREVFEGFFIDQIDKKEKDDKGPRRKRCGVCEPCQTPDCGQCSHCRDMLKFGGTGRSKQACQLRRCTNMAIQAANEESDTEEDQETVLKTESNKTLSKRILHKVKWVGEPAVEHNQRVYYYAAQVGDVVVRSEQYVMLHSEEPNQPLLIARVGYMWEDNLKNCMFHAHLFCRGSDTVLGETADPRELFVVDVCENCPVGSIVRKAQVEFKELPDNWAMNGGLDKLPAQLEDDGQTFFYSKRYDSMYSRFEDVIQVNKDPNMPYTPCNCCMRRALIKKNETAIYKDGAIYWDNEVYTIGSGVFLEPESFKFKYPAAPFENSTEKENIDDELHPEFYRKPTENLKGSNVDTQEPFCIGMIESITETSKAIMIKVRKLYRPENTSKGIFVSCRLDLNLIYWSDEVVDLDFDHATGKCYIACGDAIECSPEEWCEKGPHRFYFTESYDSKLNKFSYDLPPQATRLGRGRKGKGKGKGKSNRSESATDTPIVWQTTSKPLNCMDVFAGCGGLSEGLHQSGVTVSKWGIEKEPAAAHAFKLNNPDAIVYTEDCNELLSYAVSGEEKTGKKLPEKGEVELLVGGPPCQGFSGMNRFNAGQYSIFKNSLIVSYLSYCDYYRPKYFILENVRNFVSFKRSMVLKLTLRCLLAIGYQVAFGVLQAGHYGVPQTRRRLIIIAAAPGYSLPKFPEPQHVFNKKGCQLSVVVDSFKFNTGVRWGASAPFRTITVRDSMSDLPDIKNGCSLKEMSYDSDPISHFQRMMRKDDHTGIVKDHICKEMAALVEARMSHIPLYAGSDWRDLPNIEIRLADGSYTNKLRYPHRSKKQSKKGSNRGVCLCATGKGCDPADRQFNTLIPWCLPHTGDRHNHWAGLYGRLDWDGFFSTTVTNPEPMGKQGRVLHPEQHRVVSVRECARSQGFPDRYQFYGSILDKHRQVGNAVPPPLGLALGREIAKAYAMTEQKHTASV